MTIEQLLEAAWRQRGEGQYEEARRLVAEAHRLCEENDFNSLGRIFHIYLQFEYDHDHLEEALKFSHKSVSYYERSGNRAKVAHATRHMADLQYQLELFEEAESNYRSAIAVYRSEPDVSPGHLANALRGLGILLEQHGNMQEAIEVWEETARLYESIQLTDGVDEAKQRLVLLRRGRLSQE